MNRISVFLIAAVMLVGGVSAYSHHSAVAIYDVADEAEIQGELVQISLRNPHSYVYVNAPDADGEIRRWGIEWGGARQLTEQGAAAAFKVGDEVVVIGNPGRNARDRRLLMVSIVRPSDGYSWGLASDEVIPGVGR